MYTPDLLVNLGIVLWESLDTRETDLITDAPQYKGGQNYKWERSEVVIGVYTEGTIVMHLVDAKSDILVWKGIVEGVMVKKDKAAQRNMRIGMEHLFKEIN